MHIYQMDRQCRLEGDFDAISDAIASDSASGLSCLFGFDSDGVLGLFVFAGASVGC